MRVLTPATGANEVVRLDGCGAVTRIRIVKVLQAHCAHAAQPHPPRHAHTSRHRHIDRRTQRALCFAARAPSDVPQVHQGKTIVCALSLPVKPVVACDMCSTLMVTGICAADGVASSAAVPAAAHRRAKRAGAARPRRGHAEPYVGRDCITVLIV